MRPRVSRTTHHAPRTACHSPLATRHSQSGVALVITLLLLSIITFMTVTFLVVSRSQKGSVVSETDQAIARLAADTALERAKAELLASIMVSTNEFNYGLLVSTNYINSAGFQSSGSPSGLPYNSPLNVSYNHPNGSLLTGNDAQQNIANLLYNPRPPVFVVTNSLYPTNYDFRFYLDLNRNGVDDPNGLQPLIVRNPQGALGFTNNVSGIFFPYQWPPPPNIQSNFFVGDPEWIGSLERPEFQHSADNKFVNRYAYIAIPAGNTLDINFIHNQAVVNPANGILDSLGRDFRRDQGVGTWEINLAAFLADLNTNVFAWGGLYGDGFDPTTGSFSSPQGNAFVDAGSLLAYRYATNGRLASVSTLFLNSPNVFKYDGIDGYTTALQVNSLGFPKDPDFNLTLRPWSGADNPNHFYTTQELFDQSKTAPFGVTPTFTQRLLTAGTTTNDSYSRNTFNRLVSQLGTDSAIEPPGKLNLNYRNVDNYGNVVPGMATNFIPWTPIQFFTNAAIRLLANSGFTSGDPRYATNILVTNYVNAALVTNLNIQVWPINLYTPSVHRLLQLAANIYDASTNRTFNFPAATNLPSVFRPVFNYLKRDSQDQVFIIGYQEVQDASVFLNQPVYDLTVSNERRKIGPNGPMVSGFPLVIGAKKGLPNFNKFALQTQVQITRKIQFHRPGNSNTAPVNEMDQMLVVGITNVLGVQAWNSYASTFPRWLRMVVMPDMTVAVTNMDTHKVINPTTSRYGLPVVVIATNIPPGAWPGCTNAGAPGPSFWLPLGSGPAVPYTNCVFLSNSTYSTSLDTFVPLTGLFERNPGTTNAHVPHWQVGIRNRLRFALIDTTPGLDPTLAPNGRIVDYVNLDSIETPLDIADALMHENSESYACNPNSTSYTPSGTPGSMWCTNRVGGVSDNSVPTFGIMNQIAASLGHTSPDWKNSLNEFPAGMTKELAIAFFKNQFTPPGSNLQQTNTFAAPYQPSRNIYKVTDWEANDPLVHFTIGDLKNLQTTNSYLLDQPDPKTLPVNSLVQINQRYEPWGGRPGNASPAGLNAPIYEMRVKDPVPNLQGRSDYWDFPTNKYPNVGWLGRVHRGTPWQTVYLKSPGIDLTTWQNWTGNAQWITNFGQLSTNVLPLYFPRHYYPGTSNEIGTAFEAYLSMPTNDWHILDLFTASLSDNATRGQLSINQTNLAAWSAVLGGVVVLTNSAWVDASGNQYQDANRNPVPAPLTVLPAGVYDPNNQATWPPLARIVNAINRTRANTNVFLPVFRNQSFQSLGDILAVPELTVASPFLNTNLQPTSANYALTDAACERIPQQILGLLKCDHTPRFVVYSYGQALRPADHSLVTSGTFSRLCTNYQIMAEAATRAVLRVEGAPTNSHIIIESYNVLQPD